MSQQNNDNSKASASASESNTITYSEVLPEIVGLGVLLAITTLVVALRLWVRCHRHVKYGLEDWMMGFALMLDWTLYAIGPYIFIHFEVGVSPLDTTKEWKLQVASYVGEYLYTTLIAAVKLSILMMYYRIFPTKFIRRASVILGVVTGCLWIALMIIISYKFTPTNEHLGSNILYLCNSSQNIITDLAILLLSIYEVYRLNISRKQKIALGFVFLLGGIAVLSSIMRLASLLYIMNQESDHTYTISSMNTAGIWTVVEPSVGMISGSLPLLRPLLGLFAQKIGLSNNENKNSRDDGQPVGDNQAGGISIVTFGGTGQKRKVFRTPLALTTTVTSDEEVGRSFSRLDSAGSELHVPPAGLHSDEYGCLRTTVVAGQLPSMMMDSDEIPLNAITVTDELNQTEWWKIKE